MAKTKTVFYCTACGNEDRKMAGPLPRLRRMEYH